MSEHFINPKDKSSRDRGTALNPPAQLSRKRTTLETALAKWRALDWTKTNVELAEEIGLSEFFSHQPRSPVHRCAAITALSSVVHLDRGETETSTAGQMAELGLVEAERRAVRLEEKRVTKWVKSRKQC